MPSARVWAIAQTQDGYLWLGTGAGLVRFDGTRFVKWATLDAAPLPDAECYSLMVSRDGSLWVGFSDSKGVARIHRNSVTVYGSASGLNADYITNFLEDREGAIWAAATPTGVFRFERDRWHKVDVPDESIPISGLYETRSGTILAASGQDVLRWSASTGRFEQYALPNYDRHARTTYQSIVQDRNGTFWVIDSEHGLRSTSAVTADLSRVPYRVGGTMIIDRSGNLWAGTRGAGLWYVRNVAGNARPVVESVTIQNGLSSNTIIKVFEDRDGNIWAGTLNGLQKLSLRIATSYTDLGLVRAVEADPREGVWVATSQGLVRITSDGSRWYLTRDGLPSNDVFSLYMDPSERLWVATRAGVARIEGEHVTSFPSGYGYIFSMTTDTDGVLWLGGLDGLYRWQDGRSQKVESKSVYALRRDSAGHLWIGYGDGTLRRVGNTPIESPPAAAADGPFRVLYEDAAGAMWFGDTHGFRRQIGTQSVVLDKTAGLPALRFSAVLDDGRGHLWFGVEGAGVLRIRASEIEKLAADRTYRLEYDLYDNSDGLAGTPFWQGNPAAARDKDGYLWFVTGGGITRLDPAAALSPPGRSVRIEALYADGQRIDLRQPISLAPSIKTIRLEYAPLIFTSPNKFRYRYILEGFEDRWNDAESRRDAFYTNLPPGKYRFRVAIAGRAPDPGQSSTLEFGVEPFFTHTSTFYVMVASVTVALLGVAWQIRLRRARREVALVFSERIRLSREIHDTLLQSLVGVKFKLEGIPDSAYSTPDGIRDRLRLLAREVESYIRLTRQSIFDLRIPVPSPALAEELKRQCENLIDGTGISWEFVSEGAAHQSLPVIEAQLLRVGQEAVSNAVRHANPSKVRIALMFDETAWQLSVCDDGRGFDPGSPTNENQFGLVTMRERMELVGGRLTIKSHPGRGTTVEATVPLP